MAIMIKNKNGSALASLWERLQNQKRRLPESWTKAAGIIRDKKQRRALERHIRKMHSEW